MAKEEEAWTAQQFVDQVNASAQVENEMRDRHLAEVEYRANTLYEQEARAAANERSRNTRIIQEAQHEIQNKGEIARSFESERTQLQQELARSNQKITE